jgi:hypothetical protein
MTRQVLVYDGVNPNSPIFGNLLGLVAGCLAVGIVGGTAGILGVLIDKMPKVKEFFYKDRPNRNLGNLLFRLGFFFCFLVLFNLFDYVLSPWAFQLELTALVGLVAIGALISGVLLLKGK